jgi:hypothetical protein
MPNQLPATAAKPLLLLLLPLLLLLAEARSLLHLKILAITARSGCRGGLKTLDKPYSSAA